MSYLEIISIIFAAIWTAVSLMVAHYVIFTIIGIFARKKFPATEQKLKYGIVIGARNEERVIGALLDSIKNTDYPADKLQVFVVAHNCTDETARIAREKGATVYEYDNPDERTVGYAYRYLFGKISADFGASNFDGFFIINADNTLKKDYFTKMNDAFVATDKSAVITSYRNSNNFGANVMSCLYGIFFISACRFESRGRTACGCSTRVSGTGYLFNSELVENGWEYVTLTEDWEFTADRVANGSKVMYCDEAEFFDEQPTTVKVMLRQRLRWARGHMIVFFTRYKALIKRLFTPKRRGGKHKGSVYDSAVSIMPLGVIGVCITILQLIMIALCPLFGYDALQVWKSFGISTGFGIAGSYILTLLSAVLLVIIEHKRIPRVNFFVMLGAILLWPFFILLNVVLDVAALFVKNLEWKVIPHGQSKSARREIGKRVEKADKERAA